MKRPFLKPADAISALAPDGMQSVKKAFSEGAPYVRAATILSLIGARQYAHGWPGKRPPLKFRSQVQWDDYLGRAQDAAIEAAATWAPRDRRAGFEAFKKHVFAAINKILGKPTIPQGIATAGEDGIWSNEGGHITFSVRADEDGNPYKPREDDKSVLDLGAQTPEVEDGCANDETLAAFRQRYTKRDYDLATAVAPYTSNTPKRYAQQLRKKDKWDDAARMELEQEIVRAANLLHAFKLMWRPRSRMLDFDGVSPVPVHRVLHGIEAMPLPGVPPVGPELLGPFWNQVARLVPGLPGQIYRVGDKEDGALQPQAREYLLKLLVWYSALSEEVRSQNGSQALAEYVRRNPLKPKKSTRKP